MKKILFITLLLGQILMAATVEYVTIKGVSVPLIFEQSRKLPIASMQVVFKDSGSLEDGVDYGLAKLSARMMNEGSAKRGSEAFAEALDSHAISLSAHTGSETFVFQLESLKEEFARAQELFAELFTYPNFTPEILAKVKTTTLGQLSRKENDYDYVANNLLQEVMYANTPLAHNANGDAKSIQAITLEEIEAFIKEHIVLSRAIILIGGDMTLDEAKKSAQTVLAPLAVGKAKEVPFYSVVAKPQTKILKRETEQAYLYFGSPYDMKVGDSEYYKARVATFILGTGGFGSRLMEEIRVKRGLAYSAYARVHVAKSHSNLTGYLQTKLESLDEAKKTVISVFDTFAKSGVTQEELDQAKKFLLGSEPLRVETMSQRLSRTFQEFYKYHKLGASAQELAAIKNLKLDDLNSYIKKHQEILALNFAIVTK